MKGKKVTGDGHLNEDPATKKTGLPDLKILALAESGGAFSSYIEDIIPSAMQSIITQSIEGYEKIYGTVAHSQLPAICQSPHTVLVKMATTLPLEWIAPPEQDAILASITPLVGKSQLAKWQENYYHSRMMLEGKFKEANLRVVHQAMYEEGVSQFIKDYSSLIPIVTSCIITEMVSQEIIQDFYNAVQDLAIQKLISKQENAWETSSYAEAYIAVQRAILEHYKIYVFPGIIEKASDLTNNALWLTEEMQKSHDGKGLGVSRSRVRSLGRKAGISIQKQLDAIEEAEKKQVTLDANVFYGGILADIEGEFKISDDEILSAIDDSSKKEFLSQDMERTRIVREKTKEAATQIARQVIEQAKQIGDEQRGKNLESFTSKHSKSAPKESLQPSSEGQKKEEIKADKQPGCFARLFRFGNQKSTGKATDKANVGGFEKIA